MKLHTTLVLPMVGLDIGVISSGNSVLFLSNVSRSGRCVVFFPKQYATSRAGDVAKNKKYNMYGLFSNYFYIELKSA